MNVDSVASPTPPVKATSPWYKQQAKIAPYLFIAPFFILFSTFFLFPSLAALILSFLNGMASAVQIGLACATFNAS